MKITFYGHNTLLITINETNVLIDPFISGNPLSKDKIDINDIKADYILLTHAHQDHVLDAEAIAKNNKAIIVSNHEIATYYQNLGIEVHPMNHGGAWNFNFGKVKYVNAIHTSSFADGTYGGQPGGFIIESTEKSIYIAGDTALTMDMKLIPLRYTLDLAILPIGDNFTMGIEDAVIASDFIECDKILGVHYDTFGYIEIDHNVAKQSFAEKNKELILLNIEESITL
ncbi:MULTISPECIES: metal-dependent hydrolase [Aquimarina]|uniref:metal-dependent hydrolase n=1 Tax=Aquimarina TaxID=290174 RepID=UPI000CDF2575|nr:MULTISPECIES: metal-dependent hydrolase [Aquimarina]